MPRLIMILTCSLLVAWPVYAGIFGKKNKPGPQRVSELVGTLLNHPDASKRADAAAELAEADAATHPEVVHALIEALRKDSSSTVRRAAASSLGKLQPPTLEAAEALEQAIKHDDSWTVRVQARMARLGYRVPKTATTQPRTDSVPASPSQDNSAVKPLLIPSGAKPSVIQSTPSSRSPRSVPTSEPHPQPFPGINPSNLELAPPPRLQPTPGSSNNPTLGNSTTANVTPSSVTKPSGVNSSDRPLPSGQNLPVQPALLTPKATKSAPSSTSASSLQPDVPLAPPSVPNQARPEKTPPLPQATPPRPAVPPPVSSSPEPLGPILVPPQN